MTSIQYNFTHINAVSLVHRSISLSSCSLVSRSSSTFRFALLFIPITSFPSPLLPSPPLSSSHTSSLPLLLPLLLLFSLNGSFSFLRWWFYEAFFFWRLWVRSLTLRSYSCCTCTDSPCCTCCHCSSSCCSSITCSYYSCASSSTSSCRRWPPLWHRLHHHARNGLWRWVRYSA